MATASLADPATTSYRSVPFDRDGAPVVGSSGSLLLARDAMDIDLAVGGSLSMSLVVAAVASNSVAVAGDSILVEISAGGVVVRADHSKIVRVGNRIAALAGVVEADGQSLLPALAEALRTACDLDAVLATFVVEANDTLQAASRHWDVVTGAGAHPERFLGLFLAERSAIGGPVVALEVLTELDGGRPRLVPRTVAASGVTSHVTVLGSSDLETLRVASAYRSFHQLETLRRTRPPPPAPIAIAASIDRLALEEVVRSVVEQAITRERLLPRPAWWPVEVSLLAGPVHSASL